MVHVVVLDRDETICLQSPVAAAETIALLKLLSRLAGFNLEAAWHGTVFIAGSPRPPNLATDAPGETRRRTD